MCINKLFNFDDLTSEIKGNILCNRIINNKDVKEIVQNNKIRIEKEKITQAINDFELKKNILSQTINKSETQKNENDIKLTKIKKI